MTLAEGRAVRPGSVGPKSMPHLRILNAVRARLFRTFWKRRFGAWGPGSLVVAPVAIEGEARIHLGRDVLVAAGSCLAASPLTGEGDCRLTIGDGSRIGRFNHIYATRGVTLGRKVLTANGVYISDNLHGFSDPSAAIMDQPIVQRADVHIGDGTWIGHNACIIGARIGRNCVIGANAVVTRDVPDHCVVVGVPAVIVKRFDAATSAWRATSPDGAFRP